MGNYNGTIRCGYCHGEGHNSRTCPTKLERLQRNFENAKESDSYVDYYGRQIAKMTGKNPETGESIKRRYEGYGRKCSYCKEHGHNRRKCEQLSADVTRYAALTAKTRAAQRALMIEQGVGVGAMVRWSGGVYLVETVKVGKCHPKDRHVQVKLRPMNPSQRVGWMSVIEDPDQSRYSGYTVLSPVNADQINKSLPDDWETQPLDIKDESLAHSPFEKGQARDRYYWNRVDESGD